jgi:hypothetical protein
VLITCGIVDKQKESLFYSAVRPVEVDGNEPFLC